MRHGLLITAALLLSMLSPRLLHGQTPQTPRRPNVVLIISDDQAWTDYGFMGHPHIGTPQLDRLASQSSVFRRGYVPSSVCGPSLAALITGLYPHQNKITGNDPAQELPVQQGREIWNMYLDNVPTLPRVLSEQGYLSFQAGKWWQGSYRRGGFTNGMTRGERHGDDGLKIGRVTMQPVFDFIAEARRANQPFMVWYAPMMPHSPHTPPVRLLEKYRPLAPSPSIAAYWAMCEWFSETCGSLLDHLDEQKLADDTIVIYLADNGWLQDPDKDRFAPKSKLSPYDFGVRTPIMIRWPGKVQPRMTNSLASSLDLLPTILAALGLKPTAGLDKTGGMQGINLLDDQAVAAQDDFRRVLHSQFDPHGGACKEPAVALGRGRPLAIDRSTHLPCDRRPGDDPARPSGDA